MQLKKSGSKQPRVCLVWVHRTVRWCTGQCPVRQAGICEIAALGTVFLLMKNSLPPLFLFWPLLSFVKASADDVWWIETVVRENEKGVSSLYCFFGIYTCRGDMKGSMPKATSVHGIVQGHVPWWTPVEKAVNNCLSCITLPLKQLSIMYILPWNL
jgi:hypothetical protein